MTDYGIIKEYVETRGLIVLAQERICKSDGKKNFHVPERVLLDPREITCLAEFGEDRTKLITTTGNEIVVTHNIEDVLRRIAGKIPKEEEPCYYGCGVHGRTSLYDRDKGYYREYCPECPCNPDKTIKQIKG